MHEQIGATGETESQERQTAIKELIEVTVNRTDLVFRLLEQLLLTLVHINDEGWHLTEVFRMSQQVLRDLREPRSLEGAPLTPLYSTTFQNWANHMGTNLTSENWLYEYERQKQIQLWWMQKLAHELLAISRIGVPEIINQAVRGPRYLDLLESSARNPETFEQLLPRRFYNGIPNSVRIDVRREFPVGSAFVARILRR